MKKHLLLIVLSFFLGVSLELTTNAFTITNSDQNIVITPVKTDDSENDYARAPVLLPVSSFYQSMTSSIILNYRFDVGDVNVEIKNSFNGDYYTYNVDSSEGFSMLQIQGEEGFYEIVITLQSGAKYIGHFEKY